MTEAPAFVRLCPRCGHANSELADQCEKDGEYIGGEASVPRREAGPTDPCTVSTQAAAPLAAAPPGGVLYLEFAGSDHRVWPVASGQVVGKDSPTGHADVRLMELPELEYLSREQCRFEAEGDRWFVVHLGTALNPTLLGETPLPADQRVPLRRGDRLTLASLKCTVRFSAP